MIKIPKLYYKVDVTYTRDGSTQTFNALELEIKLNDLVDQYLIHRATNIFITNLVVNKLSDMLNEPIRDKDVKVKFDYDDFKHVVKDYNNNKREWLGKGYPMTRIDYIRFA